MSICYLPDGAYEARVQFDAQEPKRFKYATRAEAQELVDSERTFWLLRGGGVKAPCTNGQIHAAADALLRAPCEQDVALLRWTRSKSRWIRSWSRDGSTYAVYARRRAELFGQGASMRRRDSVADIRLEGVDLLALRAGEELFLFDDKPLPGFQVE